MELEKIEQAAGEIWLYLSEIYKLDVDIEDIITILYDSMRE